MDVWLLELAQLFWRHVLIYIFTHIDLHELSMEMRSEAFEKTMTSEKARNLFDRAALKFQEVVAWGFFNWGNALMCASRKKFPRDESVDKETADAQLQNATFISGNGARRILKETQKVETRRLMKSTPCHERSSIRHCMIIVDEPTDGKAEEGKEEIMSAVNVKTQRLKSELKIKIHGEKMNNELVEMEMPQMEQRIFLQRCKVEIPRQRLEKIECELHLSRAGSSPIDREGGSSIKKLLQVCFDPSKTNIEDSASRMINEEDLGNLRSYSELAKNLEEDLGKFITTLKVSQDSNIADLGKLTEKQLGRDQQGFIFITLRNPFGASMFKEKKLLRGHASSQFARSLHYNFDFGVLGTRLFRGRSIVVNTYLNF